MSPSPDSTHDAPVRVDKVVAEGDGLGRLSDGRVVFVEGALPGELVRIRVVKQSRDYARAVVSEILEPNPQRVDPPCVHVGDGCGGCDLQHASLELQKEIKVGIVRESLERLGRIAAPDLRTNWFSSLVGARTTMRVARSVDGRAGLRRRRSHDVVRIDHCLVVRPELSELVAGLTIPRGVDEVTARVAAATSERGVWWEPSDRSVESAERVDVSGATGFVHEKVLGRQFQVSMGSFFQSSPEAAEVIVGAVTAALGSADTWPSGPFVDMYGGVGLFSALVPPVDREVVLIEGNPLACADARVNLADRPARVVDSRVEDWTPERAAAVVADPARDGLRAKAVGVIAATETPVLVLVSCDPASLGRDARLLTEAGYEFDSAEILDPFPHTHHVEVVSRFVRHGRL
jgi:23S rRNA (uracil1939-C5)-methyltransferase